MLSFLKRAAVVAASGVVVFVAGVVRADLTGKFLPLAGDGRTDDSAAIQQRLDAGMSCVYLPPPVQAYLVARTLRIPSGCELRLDRWTCVRLADGVNAPLLANANPKEGNRRIAVTGGVWDFNNLGQLPNPGAWNCLKQFGKIPAGTPDPAWPTNYYSRSHGMTFYNVSELEIRNVTLRNPVTYALRLGGVTDFTIDTVVFDFTVANPSKANMDGIHLDGGCRFGRISNLRGTCFDDLLALNADDGDQNEYAHEGPITDIDVDGIHAEYCHSAVRLLSTGMPIERVSIRNIHGNFYRYAVGVTFFFWDDRPSRGKYSDITIADCHVGKARQPEDLPWTLAPFPLIYVDHRIDIDSLTIRSVTRDERTDASVPTVGVVEGARIDQLSLRDCVQVDRTEKGQTTRPLAFDEQKDASAPTERGARIGRLILSDCLQIDRTGKGLEFFEIKGKFRN